MYKLYKPVVLFLIFTLLFVFDAFSQSRNIDTIETETLTVFTFNYQKGKYDKGIVKNKSFVFDFIKKGNEVVISRYSGSKRKKQASIGVKKVANDLDGHVTYYSSKYKTTICLKEDNVIIHFAEHMDQPSEIRVYSIGVDANELVHPTMASSK